MTRLLFWIALIILVVMAVRSKLRAAMARAQGPVPGAGQEAGPAGSAAGGSAWRRVEDESERMSCCAHCGIYFPSSEAVTASGRDFCSPAHAQESSVNQAAVNKSSK